MDASKVKSILFHDEFFDSNVMIKPQILFISGSKVTTISKARRGAHKQEIDLEVEQGLALSSEWLFLGSRASQQKMTSSFEWRVVAISEAPSCCYLFRQLRFDDRSKFDLVEIKRGS